MLPTRAGAVEAAALMAAERNSSFEDGPGPMTSYRNNLPITLL